MSDTYTIHAIAHIHTDFPTKFGIPRQSGLVDSLRATIVFTPEYRNPDAVRGMEDYDYIWLIWQFSAAVRDTWSPTVRPPRLGGNTRMGVFATRSPFRPNALGLSSVKLERVELDSELGPVLHVSGADLMDGTPIFDIKPYAPYADSHPDAAAGFTDQVAWEPLTVDIPADLLSQVPADRRDALRDVLAQDPRPSYQRGSTRTYGLAFAGLDVKFSVEGKVLTVTEICRGGS
jgi:tRNA-Thr(GGU) m(6)t(6)A37 methyltransferase TsaA